MISSYFHTGIDKVNFRIKTMWFNICSAKAALPLVVIWICCGYTVEGNAPEKGKIVFDLSSTKKCDMYTKTLYSKSMILLNVNDHKEKKDITLSWVSRGSSCFSHIFISDNLEDNNKGEVLDYNQYFFKEPWLNFDEPMPGNYTGSDCDDHLKSNNWQNISTAPFRQQKDWWPIDRPKTGPSQEKSKKLKRDEKASEPDGAESSSIGSDSSDVIPIKWPAHAVAQIPNEGTYLVYVCIGGDIKDQSVEVTVEMKSDKGYLSAHEFPLLSFYMIMCIVYSLFGFIWLVLSACNYQDLLRIQFWIGGVIFLGMIEKAVFFAEYNGVNITGESTVGAYKFAEVVSSMKKAVARMLVIVVSLGFGIVKPRLGPMLYRVIAAGMLYFLFSSAEALIRSPNPLHDPENKVLTFIFIPLAIIDSIICWWIFISLLQTMKTLRLRRNVVKLSLYRHFSNTIIFCVLASIGLLLWSIRLHNTRCIADWSELWLETAMWHVLFSVILFVIMVLWRPNANNQRYAYSPMIDGNDSDMEEQELMLGSGAVENMKSRARADPDFAPADDIDKTEEDLKWIEENIPQTVADSVAPALIDSDEDEMTTKYEMSKIE